MNPNEAGESPSGGKRRTVVDLVLWSFVIALTPVALGMAWNLIPRVGDLNGLGLSRAFEDAEQRTEAEYRRPFADHGFRLTRVVPTAGGVSVVEDVPV